MTRVALVLGAGGITGHAFHAGVLRAIEEATGWDPRAADLVVGTSAGSIVGAALRAGLSAHDLHARATGEPLSLEGERLLAEVPPPGSLGDLPRRRRRVPAPASPGLVVRQLLRPWRARPSLVMAGLLPEGRLDIGTVADEMRHLTAVAGRLVDDLWVTAVRLDDGRRVAFGRPGDPTAPVADAVAASCAIPGIMAPVEIDGVRYVDGGAHSPTNADLVAGAGFDLVVVSSPMSSVRSARRAALDGPVRVMYRFRLATEVRLLRRRGTAVVVFQPTPADLAVMGWNALDPARRAPVARRAHASALRRCERPGRELATLSSLARPRAASA